ncbi:short-chain dehydrogenase [Aquimarina aggregata]|uniref:Short-chain dehydrogenase n=1 Tax=Aquimarina aggregata TaxID=1642818 RepID=A0A163D4N1_9FLAO|nr:SDR family oxidoreductase [Aquimarina aggregata]KZS42992.1 short-chain dehydrogenase [Aquimarina aggregata]
MTRKNILITGASSGLGKGMAIEFAKQGCNLALCARRVEKLELLKKELQELNPNIHVFLRALDVTKQEDVFKVFKAFEVDFKNSRETLDRVIINAGMGKGASLGKGYAKQNMQTAMTNFCGAISQMEAAMEIFREQNHGHLVLISSMSAFRGYPRAMTVYAATKAGVKSLAEGLRVDVLHKPIKVSTIFPGYIESEMTDSVGKPPPFMIALDKGSKLLVKSINKEKAKTFVPYWPWYFIKLIMPFMPLKMLRKF